MSKKQRPTRGTSPTYPSLEGAERPWLARVLGLALVGVSLPACDPARAGEQKGAADTVPAINFVNVPPPPADIAHRNHPLRPLTSLDAGEQVPGTATGATVPAEKSPADVGPGKAHQPLGGAPRPPDFPPPPRPPIKPVPAPDAGPKFGLSPGGTK